MAVWNEMGQRLQRLRGKRTQQEVAGALKIKRETIAQWENETRRIKDVDIIRLADYYGCTCDYILRGIESENVDIHKETGLSDYAIRILKTMTVDSLASKYDSLEDIDFMESISTLLFLNWAIEGGLLTDIAKNLLEASGEIALKEESKNNRPPICDHGPYPDMIASLEGVGCVVLTPTRLLHYYRAEAQSHYDELAQSFSNDKQFFVEYAKIRDQAKRLFLASSGKGGVNDAQTSENKQTR